MGPVDEGSGPNHHHPQYGEARYGGITRPVQGSGGCEKKLAASGESDDRDIGGGESTTNGRIDPGMIEDWNSNRKRVNSKSSDRDAARGSGGGTDREADTVPIVDEAAGVG
jgi:hypothetical protein